ncbi:response regulator [bacterium]|nr:response regulator [bacterium]
MSKHEHEYEQEQEVILLVEDEPDIANLIELLLGSCGYKVLWDIDGKGVIDILEKEPSIDLILLDLALGENDGLDIAARIRNNERWKDLPIIMVTCRNRQEDKIKGLTAGGDDYITKPFNNEELVLRVKTRLRIKALEDRLRVSEEKFRRLSENAQDIIYRINAEQGFDYVNPAVERITGYSQEEILDMGVHGYLNLIHESDRENLARGLARLCNRDGDAEIEYRLRTRKGGWIWLHDKRIPVYDDKKGRLIAVEGIIRDVTEQKKMEEKKLQIEKLKALQHLAGGAAHHINQPLSCIKGFLKIFEDKVRQSEMGGDNETLADVELVEEAIDRISDIVQKLLSIDTIETEAYPSGGEILDLDKSSRGNR